MNKAIYKSCILWGLILVSGTAVTSPETYTLDPQHTYVLWHADHFGFSHPSGKWMANGKLEYDKENLEKSKVSVEIATADLVTGIKELDQHLKGKLFFDVEKYPKATFVSDKIEVKNKEIASVQGILNVHGVSKPVTLQVKLNKMAKNPINEKETIGFSAKTQLKRSDFGIKTLIPGVSDDIEIEVEVEGYQ